MSLDLEHQLVFKLTIGLFGIQYGAYHHNKVNIAIHIVCVPLILFSGFCLATYTGPLVELPEWLTVPYLEVNLGTIAAFAYSALYLLLEPVAGFALAALCMGAAAGSNYFKSIDSDLTLKSAIAVHVISWLAQFVGHGAFEKRAPALLDNLIQAIFLAPMFVWLEILFFLGYRPELQARVEKRVQGEIAKFKEESKNGKAS